MIIDVTGIELIPGNCGNQCPGSWELAGLNCCCNECDYVMCCQENHDMADCRKCTDPDCPHALGQSRQTQLLQKKKNNA